MIGRDVLAHRSRPCLALALGLSLSLLGASRGAAASDAPLAGASSPGQPLLRLKGVPAGDLLEIPGRAAKAEVVQPEPSLAEGLSKVAMEGSVAVSDFPVAPGERADVVLTRRDVYAPNAEIWEMGPGGKRRVPRSSWVFLWGQSERPREGAPEVRVMVRVDPASRELYSFSVTPNGAYELQRVPKSWKVGQGYVVGPHDLFLDRAAQSAQKGWTCGEEGLPKPLDWLDGGAPPPPEKGLRPDRADWEKAGITSLHTATLAFDTDNELMHLKFANSGTAATNYIASLVATMNVMYERDLLVRLLQGFTILRPSPSGNPTDYTTDPYNQGCGASCAANGSQLNEFSSFWSGGCAGACVGVSRALGVMLSGKQSSDFAASGIATVGTLCSTSSGYSFSQVFKFAANTEANDVLIVGHEIGHNFGSPHTHCYSPPIDNCYGAEGGCYHGATSCPAAATYSGVPNVQGTVMSYCQFVGGCGVSAVFHPATIDRLDDIILSHATGLNACILPFGPPTPTVTSAAPASGSTAGGSAATITGTNFAAGATVTFDTGGGAVAGTVVVVVNSTTITVLAPAHATGAVRVTVTNPSAQAGFRDSAYFFSPPPTASGFFTITPCRVVDTRNAAGPRGGPILAPNASRLFTVTGVCGIPASAKAVSANLTVVGAASSGSFTFYPGNAFPLGTTNLNFPASATRASASVLKLSTNGTGSIGVLNSSSGNNHLLIDVNGYFQ